MSSPSASTSLISSAVLAAQAYVPKLDMFLASLANVGLGADQKTVVSAMKVFKKWLWHKGQAAEVTWSREHELQEWCMARYMENAGAAWLVPFEANFAPAPPSIDEQLASLLADDGPFTLWTELSPNSKVAAYIEPLVQMDLARQECQWAEAATQSAAIMSAEREAELLEEQRVALAKFSAKRTADTRVAGFLEAGEEGAASGGEAVEIGEAAAGSTVAAVEAATAEPADESEAPENDDDADNEDDVLATPKRVPTTGGSGRSPVVIKRASKSTTPSKRRTQKVVPQYEPPTATTFTDAQLRNLLVPHQDEVVLDNDRCAGENVPGVKGKKTVSLAARDNFKSLKGSCDKCWADNNPKCCWYPTGAQPCHRCDALKRACTISSRKFCECGKVNSHVQRNFEKAVLVWQVRAFVLEQRKLSLAGKAISISVSSLALPTAQELGYVVDVVDLVPPTPKGKAKATSMPHKRRASAAGDEPPAKRSRSGTASRKVAKTVPCQEETPPMAGPSRQIVPVDLVEPVLRPGGVVLSNPESSSETEVPSEHEEEAELSDVSESLSEVPAVPHRAVQPNYAPLPTPRVNGQEFTWLGKALDYPISALCPAEYIEAAKEKAEGITAVLRKDMRVVALEMERLRLRKKIMECSVDILERYQADCTEALEWQQANEAHLQQPFTTLFPLPPDASLDP
ncbi:hypothetical protein C0992_001926 [Termitomyces sp. T32_za158]|nr:hypothetical protein C0992_001926 [Termitomyces sp. T32_za158]